MSGRGVASVVCRRNWCCIWPRWATSISLTARGSRSRPAIPWMCGSLRQPTTTCSISLLCGTSIPQDAPSAKVRAAFWPQAFLLSLNRHTPCLSLHRHPTPCGLNTRAVNKSRRQATAAAATPPQPAAAAVTATAAAMAAGSGKGIVCGVCECRPRGAASSAFVLSCVCPSLLSGKRLHDLLFGVSAASPAAPGSYGLQGRYAV